MVIKMDEMEMMQILIDTLNRATKAYDEGCPYMSDKEWDQKYFELAHLEKTSGIYFANSPTQAINYVTVNALEKVEHEHKMLSLEKTKDLNEIKSFIGGKEVLIMAKLDGLTCSLTYQNGHLIKAETRGNGIVGENILHNAMVIPSIPKIIPYYGKLVVDGEIICTLKDFENYADEYKNSRNFAAGSIRLLSSQECENRKLTFVAWEVIEGFNDKKFLSEKFQELKKYDFEIVPHYACCNTEVLDHFTEMVKNESKEYPIDGLVYKFNHIEYGKTLGETAHHFKNAMAFKFYDEVYYSDLEDIDWTMGRTGILTPTACFKPVEIDGSTIERASLHNISVMYNTLKCSATKDGILPIKGQKVGIFKSNMIIPQICESYCDDMEEYTFIHIPTVCPICGHPTERVTENESTVLMCTNNSCEGKLINRLDHFCGKKGLDIKGLSKATLEKLIDWGWVENFTDIFELSSHKEDWIKKPGFGIKSVEKILDAIDSSKKCSLNNFITALGIPLIGSTASKELMNNFKTWDNFIEAINKKFYFWSLPNFGQEMHRSIINFDYTESKLLAEHYIDFNIPEEKSSISAIDLSGKTFVITGKLNHYKNRDEIKNYIESLGGKVTGSVSKNTNYLINNDKESTSSKNVSAKKLGVEIITEKEFLEKFDFFKNI